MSYDHNAAMDTRQPMNSDAQPPNLPTKTRTSPRFPNIRRSQLGRRCWLRCLALITISFDVPNAAEPPKQVLFTLQVHDAEGQMHSFDLLRHERDAPAPAVARFCKDFFRNSPDTCIKHVLSAVQSELYDQAGGAALRVDGAGPQSRSGFSMQEGVNAVSQSRQPHHAIIQQFGNHWAHPLGSHVIDISGTHTDASFDCQCDILQYCEVPNRKAQCEFAAQWGRIPPAAPIAVPPPLIDEEYFQWVAVLEAAARAGDTFVMLELGARYGTWIVRGARAHQKLHANRSHVLIATEPSPHWAHRASLHCALNGLNCTVHEGWHGPPGRMLDGMDPLLHA